MASELRSRVLVGVAAGAVTLACVWAGGLVFRLFAITFSGIAAVELEMMLPGPNLGRYVGMIYPFLAALALVSLRDGPSGLLLVLFTLTLVWAADTGAYFAGRGIGGPRLWPRVSPNKTWAGLGGGVIAAAVTGGLVARYASWDIARSALAAAALAVVATGGDLFESWLKRRAGVKDSGSILGPHGGVMDRVDGLIPVACAVGAFEAFSW